MGVPVKVLVGVCDGVLLGVTVGDGVCVKVLVGVVENVWLGVTVGDGVNEGV